MTQVHQVPSYDRLLLKEKSSRYMIAIPVINEGEKIQKQLKRMMPYSAKYDVLIADGGSTDDSLNPDFLKTTNVRGVLTKTGPGKLSAQMRMAMSFAMDQGYEGIIFIDGNNKDNPEAINSFAQLLDEGFDHIQGSRFIPGGIHENTPAARFWGIKLVHAPMISLAARFRYTDTTNGFRAYSRKLLLDPRVQPFRDVFSQYELHYYMAIRAARLGFKVIETPVERKYPATGKTPTKIKGFRGNFLVLRTLFNACMGKFNPESK